MDCIAKRVARKSDIRTVKLPEDNPSAKQKSGDHEEE